mgnify:FL=1
MKIFHGLDLRYVAVCLALIGAVAMAFGAQWQNDAVGEQQGKGARTHGAVNFKQMLQLLKRRRWLLGSVFLTTAFLCQIAALSLAPLIVVQPLGAIGLLVTSILNARINQTKLNRATRLAIALCVLGIGGFVATASTIAKEYVLTDSQIIQIGSILVVILAVEIYFMLKKPKGKAIYFIMAAGVLYGFLATLTKVVIQRLFQQDFSLLTLVAVVILVVGAALGGWLTQNAYASGPPDLVIAGLTVIDPMVAVIVASTILGEAAAATPLTVAMFIGFGVFAIVGVLVLSQFHPEILLAKRKAAVWAKRKKR